VGVVPIAIGLGAIDAPVTKDTPGWVVAAAGLMLVCAGLATIVGYAMAGGSAPDGDLPPGTPLSLRVLQSSLGFLIAGLLFAIFFWIAFGEGERRFSAVIFTPFGVDRPEASEWQGRAVFGVASAMAALIWIVGTILSARGLKRAIRRRLE
jgi:hypothetical protein